MKLGQDPELEQLRERVRVFIATHEHGTRSRTGVRAPEPEEMPALRAWAAALHAESLLKQVFRHFAEGEIPRPP